MSLQPGNGNPDDIERGRSIDQRGKSIVSLSGFQGMDEYTALQRYILSYRDPKTNPKPEAAQEKKKPWWALWRPSHTSSSSTLKQVATSPEEWLTTDLRNGLQTSEVDARRKQVGYNELTSEKESMLKKFLGYFNGPVLWGEFGCELWSCFLC